MQPAKMAEMLIFIKGNWSEICYVCFGDCFLFFYLMYRLSYACCYTLFDKITSVEINSLIYNHISSRIVARIIYFEELVEWLVDDLGVTYEIFLVPAIMFLVFFFKPTDTLKSLGRNLAAYYSVRAFMWIVIVLLKL